MVTVHTEIFSKISSNGATLFGVEKWKDLFFKTKRKIEPVHFLKYIYMCRAAAAAAAAGMAYN